MKFDYDMKEERRVDKRKEQKSKLSSPAKRSSSVSTTTVPKSVQIDRTKKEHVKEGQQLLELREKRYGKKVIDELPEDVKKEITVSHLKEKGITASNKEMQKRKEAMKKERVTRGRRSSLPSVGIYRDNAKNCATNYNKVFGQRSSINRETQEVLKKFSTPSFWNKIKASKYIETLEVVIPCFWTKYRSELDNLGRLNKTKVQGFVNHYLKKLVEISEGKILEREYLSYTNGVSLEQLSYKFERLAVILKIDNAPDDLDEITSRMCSPS